MFKSSNTVWHSSAITRAHRELKNQHRSFALWFTGLSGAGKSTLAHAVEAHLHRLGCRTYVLDGDNVRHGLCCDLGFSPDDRRENIRRIGEVVKLLLDAGTVVSAAFISPFRADRELVRGMMTCSEFIEIYCQCNLEVCEERDVKGLYKRARSGEIKEFTGISSPYETPITPELILNTANHSLQTCLEQILNYLEQRGLLPLANAPVSQIAT